MRFTLGGKEYKIVFNYKLYKGFPYFREEGICIVYTLEGERSKEIAHVNWVQVRKGRILNRPQLRKKLLSIAFKKIIPNSLSVEWKEQHIQIPFKAISKLNKSEEEKEKLIQEYVKKQLAKSQLVPHIRGNKDAVERFRLWEKCCEIHPSTIPKVSNPHLREKEIGFFVGENYL